MSFKYSLLGAVTVDPVSTAAETCSLHLSDGTFVTAVLDAANNLLDVYVSPTHTTASLVAQLPVTTGVSTTEFNYTASSTDIGQFAMCRDASDNLYIFGWCNTSNFPTVGRIKLTLNGALSNYTWTTGTFVSGASGITPAMILGVVWCNTGGGTGGAGHILFATCNGSYAPTSGATQLETYDAGNLGTARAGAAVTTTAEVGWAGCLAQDGFGAAAGTVAGYNSAFSPANGVIVSGWAVTSGGTVTVADGGALAGGGVIEEGASLAVSPLRLLRYAPGSYAIVGPSGVNAGHWVIFTVSSTGGAAPALLGISADSGAPAGIWLSAHTQSEWDAFVDPNTPNRVWVLTYNSSTPTAAALLSCIVGVTNTWAGTITAGDTFTGGNPTTITVVRQPVGLTVDWLAYLLNGNPSVSGDSTFMSTPPNAPTLTSPASGTYLDVTTGVALTGVYNSTDTSTQNAYALRIKQSGAGSYSYWNAGSASVQSSIVWNPVTTSPGASWTVSLPAAVVANGNTYNWSLASQESSAGLQGPFASDFTFNAQLAPTLSVTGPTGTVTATQAVVTWTTTPPAGASQTAYRIVLYTAVQYTVGGFTAGISPSTWDSGVVTSAMQTATAGAVLQNGVSYRVYVQVTETGGETSTWQYSGFTVTYASPATPLITATPTVDAAGCPTVTVTVTGQDNLLSAVDASFETGVGTWVAGTNWTIVQDSTHVLDGSWALKCTRTDTTAGSGSAATGAYTVIPGATYTLLASIYADTTTTGKTYTAQIQTYPAGVVLGTVNVTLGAAGTWTAATVTFTVPAGDTAVLLVIDDTPQTTPASGQLIWVDNVGLMPGTNSIWSRGGLTGATTANITYPDPATGLPVPVRQATGGVALPAGSQQASVIDTEVTPGAARTYTATVSATV